jgi:nucleotide-binding universal stress UspA family protein
MKILLPTDGSEYSEAAAKFLLKLNLSSRDEISILHVVSEDPLQDSQDYYSRRIREVKEFIAPKIIDNTMHILKSVPAKIDTFVIDGYPDTCIVDTAINLNADLIIMGPKRVKGIRSRIVGSITKSVSINSPKPILVIKPPQEEIPDKMNILFPTDGSHYAQKAGEILTLIPFHDTTEITVLHVVTPALYDIPEQYMTKMDTGLKEDLKSLTDKEFRESDEVFTQTAKYLEKRFAHFDTVTKIGDPTDEILQTAYELRPDIIALGSKGMGGFRGVIGSISRYILSVAECSVLIGKT